MPTLTNLNRTTSNLLHPIVFFEQGTDFFEMRQQFNGDWLIRQYFARQLELECGPTDEVRAELRKKGIPMLAPLRWNSTTDTFDFDCPNFEDDIHKKQIEEQKRRKLQETRERQLVGAHAATARRCPVLAVNPLEPLRTLSANLAYPELINEANPDFAEYGKFWAAFRCSDIAQRAWCLLAFVDPYEQKALRKVVGSLPDKPAEFTEMEWLLRHAFSDDRVRSRPDLATVLARMPMLFSQATETGRVTFEHEGIPKGHYGISPRHWLVVAADSGGESN